jgi:5'-nucleotidase (lipoprotein e(P4) family)
MDLDETVLDNSAFQTFLNRNGLEYTTELWADYEENYPQDVTLIPGAKHFIDRAESLGVTVVFISNRSELYRRSTKGALQRLLGADPTAPIDRLYLRAKDGSLDKSSRREEVAAKYNVLMYFGDNLRDFSESFRAHKLPQDPTPQDCLKAIAQRQSSSDDALCHWGIDWFVIPNPVYGEWENLIGADPEAIMHPSSMKLKTLRRN